jgi:hypothetical protein
MPAQAEKFLAEFDDSSHMESHPAELKSEGAVMEFDVERERAASRADLQQLLAEPAAEVIEQGVEAYKRDLPSTTAPS